MRLTTGPGREVDRHELSGSGIEDRHGSLHSLGMRETPDIPHGSNPIANVVSNSLPNDGSFIWPCGREIFNGCVSHRQARRKRAAAHHVEMNR